MNAYEKMRDALILCNALLRGLDERTLNEEMSGIAEDARGKITEALAEPRRNCDKYTSLDEARNAYMAINEMPEGNHSEDIRRWLCNFHNWLFAPHESDAEKEGGKDGR